MNTQAHTHTNASNVHTEVIKIDFCPQCNGNLYKRYKQVKTARERGTETCSELEI